MLVMAKTQLPWHRGFPSQPNLVKLGSDAGTPYRLTVVE